MVIKQFSLVFLFGISFFQFANAAVVQPADLVIQLGMRIPKKELRSGFTMPALGLGTWTITNDRTDLLPFFDQAIAAGVTHIDTAEQYGNEKLLAKQIKKYHRSKLFITSKVSGCNMSYQGIIDACKRTLAELEIEYLDLYLLHEHPSNNRYNIIDAMRALDALVEQGLVKNIGVSNFSVAELQKAQSLTQNKIVCNQVWYSLKERGMERFCHDEYYECCDLVKYCRDNDVFLVAYRPLLSLFRNGVPKIIEAMCEKYKKTPNQIALNWLMSQKNVLTIPKTVSMEHFQENLGALGWQMEEKDIELLRASYPGQTVQGHLKQCAE